MTSARVWWRVSSERTTRWILSRLAQWASDCAEVLGPLKQVMDAYLVGLARHHRGWVATFDIRLAAHAQGDGEVALISS